MKRAFALWMLIGALCGVVLSAQSTATAASAFGFTMTEDLATAQGFTYRLYADGAATSSVLSPVTCLAVSAGRTDCTVKIPAFTPGAHTIRITATNAAGEGPKSDPLDFVLVVAPGKPTSLKVQ